MQQAISEIKNTVLLTLHPQCSQIIAEHFPSGFLGDAVASEVSAMLRNPASQPLSHSAILTPASALYGEDIAGEKFCLQWWGKKRKYCSGH